MSTSLDLTPYSSVQQAIFVRLDIPDFGILRISNYNFAFNITESDSISYEYNQLGVLLNITEFNNEIRPTGNDVTIALSAIPNTYISSILDYKIKGSTVEIRRCFFNAATGQKLNISGNPALRFKGIVNNFNFSEDWNDFSQEVTTTVALSCTSIIGVLQNKIAGRRTNPADEKYFYPTDVAMDRVPVLNNSAFDFGAPPKVLTSGVSTASKSTENPAGGANGTLTGGTK